MTLVSKHVPAHLRQARILKAIELMENPEDFTTKWDMDTFGDLKWSYAGGEAKPLPLMKCNTACCFAGTLSLHPYFRARGFTGVWDETEGALSLTSTKANPGGEWWQGVQDLFGITEMEAGSLVSPNARELDDQKLHDRRDAGKGYKITPKRMIARLRVLLERYPVE